MIKLGIVMDPISDINIKKDSSFAMLLAAQSRGYQLFYMEMQDLAMVNGKAMGNMRPLTVYNDAAKWFELGEATDSPLSDLDVVLMRRDSALGNANSLSYRVVLLSRLAEYSFVPMFLRSCYCY